MKYLNWRWWLHELGTLLGQLGKRMRKRETPTISMIHVGSCKGCKHGYNGRAIKASYPCESCQRNPVVEVGDYYTPK